VASASLKPMAHQLLQDRSLAAYAGVDAYARRHAQEDAGALAWLVIGYAHTLDKGYAQAIDPLNRAKPRAGDLGDYVNFYLGTSYYQTGRHAEAVATLGAFDKAYPESLLIRDVHVVYANAVPTIVQKTKDALLQSNLNYQKDLDEVAVIVAQKMAGRENEIGERMANVYANEFTEQELKDLVTFYKSTLGQKLLSTEPKAIQMSMASMNQWAQAFADTVAGEFRAEMHKRGKQM